MINSSFSNNKNHSSRLPAKFRKLSLAERRQLLVSQDSLGDSYPSPPFELSDTMVENAIGWFEVPLGVAPGLVVNGKTYNVPLATEEPSVIAAASFAAFLLTRSQEKGLSARAGKPIMTAQIFLETDQSFKTMSKRFEEIKPELESLARKHLASMQARGGGFRGCFLEEHRLIKVFQIGLQIDVRDALGANLLNTLAENLSPFLEKTLTAKKLMAIISNEASERVSSAQFHLDVRHLAKPGFTGPEMARRLALASDLAQIDVKRAVTHNKGIMNGMSALALATGNDTRALEAAVHSFASSQGHYRGLSRYRVQDDVLIGEIELPLPLATVGGSTQIHPTAQMAWKILGVQKIDELCCVACALGLAQNFAALFSLTSQGIGPAHMRLHNRRFLPKEDL